MSSISSELQDFLKVVAKVSASISKGPEPLRHALGTLSETGLLELARDTAEEPDAIWWLANTVRVAAESSPSLAFVLAGRYAADRALGPENVAMNPTFALTVPGSRPVVATALTPDAVVVLESAITHPYVAAWKDVAPLIEVKARTGLKPAELVSMSLPVTAEPTVVSGQDAIARWDLLVGAALAGLARRAVQETRTYVMERRQFGVPVGSFVGLRAIVADMELKADAIEALLDRAMERDASSDGVSAMAGRAAIEVCLDAIQAHGGYGYIDEYPLSDLLRDAIGLQSRTGGRRFHVARVAERVLGSR